MRGSLILPRLILLVAGCWAGGVTAGQGAPAPQILDVQPARAGELLVCRLATVGLPGQKISQTMQSGLVSSIELFCDLEDEQREVVAGRRISFQLAFDLWEEVFSVEQDGSHYRFSDQAALAAFLADLPRLPVAPLSVLEPDRRFRVRVGLSMHPIAPSAREQVEEVIAGDSRPLDRGGGEQQEVSVTLGKLIRFFYKGGSGRAGLQAEASSGWFSPGELVDATN